MARVTVTFSLWSKTLRPERMTEILSAAPDRSVERGLDRDPPRPVPDAYGWHVTSREIGQPLVENTLVNLLDRISTFSDDLVQLRNVDANLDVRISITIAPYEENMSLFLSYTTVEQIGKLGASLDIEFFDS